MRTERSDEVKAVNVSFAARAVGRRAAARHWGLALALRAEADDQSA